MTTISMDADESLAGALRASVFGPDTYLTLRNADGVLWSGVVRQWTVDCVGQTSVSLRPIEEHVEQAVELWTVVKRAEIQTKLRDLGVL